MKRFRLGEVAELAVTLTAATGEFEIRAGTEVEIVELDPVPPPQWDIKQPPDYRIAFAPAAVPSRYRGEPPRGFVLDSELRKRPQRVDRWDDLERVTGWRPAFDLVPT